MPDTSRRKKSLSLRAKVAAVSVLSFLVTTACAWLRLRSTPEPIITCYEMVAPTDPPTPVVMCYEPIIEIATPTHHLHLPHFTFAHAHTDRHAGGQTVVAG